MTNKKSFLKSFIFIVFLFLLVSCKETKYTLIIDANGGLIDGKEIQEVVKTSNDEDKKVVLNDPIKNGYEFVGWVKNGVVLSENYIELDSNMTVTAKYEIINYNITYNLDGGKLDNLVYTYTIEDEINLGIPTKLGYDFTGWNLGITKINKGTTGDIALVAKYSIKEYSINYELNGGNFEGEFISKYTVEDEKTLSIPVKEGFKFVGWYLDANFNEEISVISTGTTGNITCYAKWEKLIEVYNITYVLNGGALEPGYVEVYEYGTVVELPIPSKRGSVFMGWYENSSFNGDVVEKISATDKGNKKYYAMWMDVEDIFTSLIPDTITSNLTLYTTHPDNSDIKLSWTSGDANLISNTGVINQAHKTLTTTLTMIMTYKGKTTSHTGIVNLAPVVFDSLSTGNTVVGYVYSGTLSKWSSTSFDRIFSSTALKTLDVVNYGFATVDANGNLVLNNNGFTKYLEEVLKLRQQGIRVLLCIGENSKNFSDMTFDTTKMNNFVSQVVATVEKYHFDGVDIDWEFPGVNTGRDVSIDRPNYTKLIKALRSELDKVQEKGGTKYLLTAAIPGTSWGSERYEMNILDNYLDYVNMMSYDLNNETIACHHSSLHTSTTAKAYGFSIEYGVNRFVSLGFNKNQIVVGMAFYGKYYTGATALGKSAKFGKNIHYTVIAKNYLGGGDYQQLWDDVAKAPYILNTKTGEYISYDNVRSITEKCKYSKISGIKGVMFWDYSEDTTGTLMKVIYDEMK